MAWRWASVQATLCQMGTHLPSPKRGQSPAQFSAHFYSGQMAGCIKLPLGMGVGLGPSDIVIWGPTPLQKRAQPPVFRPITIVAKTAGCIKMPLDMDVGFSPGNLVLDGDPAPFRKRGRSPGEPPIFGPCPVYSNGWMDQDGTWHGGRRWSRPHCARWGPSSPPQNGGQSPKFWPISIAVSYTHLTLPTIYSV